MFIFKNEKKHIYEAWKKRYIQDAKDMNKEEREEALQVLEGDYEAEVKRAMELIREVIKETDMEKKQALNDKFYSLGHLITLTLYFIQAIEEVNRA